MKVTNQNIFAMQEISQRANKKQTGEDFMAKLKKVTKNEEKNIEKNITNSDVDNFIQKLTSLGASAFWTQFNNDKIQEKIDEKRAELMKGLKVEKEDENLSEEERQEKENVLKEIEEALLEYAKQLQEQAIAQKELKSPNVTLSTLLNI